MYFTSVKGLYILFMILYKTGLSLNKIQFYLVVKKDCVCLEYSSVS